MLTEATDADLNALINKQKREITSIHCGNENSDSKGRTTVITAQAAGNTAAINRAGSLQLCSHHGPLSPSLRLRHSPALHALLITITVYGNPASSQHAFTSQQLTSYTSDAILQIVHRCYY